MIISVPENIGTDLQDSLEATYQFGLPPGSIGFDSWLWIENYISHGILLDRDSATQIYDEIVDIQVDPSLWTKQWEGGYELRIYPITRSMPRKIKLSFLLPTEWTREHVLATLPLSIISPFLEDEQIEIIVREHAGFSTPHFREVPKLVFLPGYNAEYGTHYQVELPATTEWGNLTLAFDAPYQNSTYVSHLPLTARRVSIRWPFFPMTVPLKFPLKSSCSC